MDSIGVSEAQYPGSIPGEATVIFENNIYVSFNDKPNVICLFVVQLNMLYSPQYVKSITRTKNAMLLTVKSNFENKFQVFSFNSFQFVIISGIKIRIVKKGM